MDQLVWFTMQPFAGAWGGPFQSGEYHDVGQGKPHQIFTVPAY